MESLWYFFQYPPSLLRTPVTFRHQRWTSELSTYCVLLLDNYQIYKCWLCVFSGNKIFPWHQELNFETKSSVVRGITPVLRSAKRAPANIRRLNNISDVIFYCSVGDCSRALALLNAARFLTNENQLSIDCSSTTYFLVRSFSFFLLDCHHLCMVVKYPFYVY